MALFKAYDIRGIYGDNLTDDIAYRIGRAFVLFLGCKHIVVGRDMRLSSDSLFASLTKGIMEQGCDVTDIGLCTTPMVYFSTAHFEVDGSIMITASHNPKEYNGFKLSREKAIPISGDTGIMEIKALCEKHANGSWPESEHTGTLTTKNVTQAYIAHLKKLTNVTLSDMTIVVDAANAAGVIEFEHLKHFADESVTWVPLYMELDGTFPNHEANPLKAECMQDVAQAVKEHNADMGIAFDGDADRSGFVDEKGELVTSDFITALIAEEYLQENKGEKILYDLRSSWATKEAIAAAGGEPIMCRVGHAFIKEQLRTENAIFGGELAGHYYFRDNFYTDSGVLGALMMLRLLQRKKSEGLTFSSAVAPLRKYFHSGEINTRVQDADAILAQLEEKYASSAVHVSRIDGIKFEYDEFWFNVRKSNTEPLLRLIVEAKTKEVMEQKCEELLTIIRG